MHVWFERALSHSGSISAELLAANTEITEGDWIVQVNQTKSNQTKSRTGKQAATQPDGTKYTREDNWTQVRLTRDRWNQSGWNWNKTGGNTQGSKDTMTQRESTLQNHKPRTRTAAVVSVYRVPRRSSRPEHVLLFTDWFCLCSSRGRVVGRVCVEEKQKGQIVKQKDPPCSHWPTSWTSLHAQLEQLDASASV